jgi:hypothetical protein
LFVLEAGEQPRFELPCSGLSGEDEACASALVRRLTAAGPADPWVQSVQALLELPPEAGPATNVALDRSVVAFHSPYVLGAGGRLKKVANRMKWLGLES